MWVRWVSLSKHSVSDDRDEVLALLRATAPASTVDEFLAAVQPLKTSRVWEWSSALQHWMDNTWLPEYKVQCIVRISTTYKPNKLCVTLSPTARKAHPWTQLL